MFVCVCARARPQADDGERRGGADDEDGLFTGGDDGGRGEFRSAPRESEPGGGRAAPGPPEGEAGLGTRHPRLRMTQLRLERLHARASSIVSVCVCVCVARSGVLVRCPCPQLPPPCLLSRPCIRLVCSTFAVRCLRVWVYRMYARTRSDSPTAAGLAASGRRKLREAGAVGDPDGAVLRRPRHPGVCGGRWSGRRGAGGGGGRRRWGNALPYGRRRAGWRRRRERAGRLGGATEWATAA